MFVNDYPVWRSTLLYGEGVGHAFSTRSGGVSHESHTRTMNTGFYRGDSDEVVRENIRLLCSYAWLTDNVVGTPQIPFTRSVTRQPSSFTASRSRRFSIR